MEMPTQGVLFNKDYLKRLDYTIVKDVYEFYISYGEVKVFDNYTKIKYKKANKECLKMTYNQFINYALSEGFINREKLIPSL
jgi:hypothetical protein